MSTGLARTMNCRDAEAPHTPSGVATPMRGRTPLETGSQMLLRYLLPGSESPVAAAGIVGEFPGQGFPAPLQARRAIRKHRALTGQIVLILQWARIVTESQSGAATGGNPSAAPRYPENITRERSKSDGWTCTNTAGFSRVFHTCAPAHISRRRFAAASCVLRALQFASQPEPESASRPAWSSLVPLEACFTARFGPAALQPTRTALPLTSQPDGSHARCRWLFADQWRAALRSAMDTLRRGRRRGRR